MKGPAIYTMWMLTGTAAREPAGGFAATYDRKSMHFDVVDGLAEMRRRPRAGTLPTGMVKTLYPKADRWGLPALSSRAKSRDL